MQNFKIKFKSNSVENDNLKIGVEQVWRQAERKNFWQQRITKMARFVLNWEVCVFYKRKTLTEKFVHFKSPLMLCANRCG